MNDTGLLPPNGDLNCLRNGRRSALLMRKGERRGVHRDCPRGSGDRESNLHLLRCAASRHRNRPVISAGSQIPGITETDRLAGVVAVVGVTESQPPVLAAEAVNEVGAALATWSVCGGVLPPADAAKLIEVGLSVRAPPGRSRW